MRCRPTLCKAENAELARKFCMLGATNEDLARCFDVSRTTIDHWIDTIAEFAEGIQEGRDLADAAVIQKLRGPCATAPSGALAWIGLHALFGFGGILQPLASVRRYPPVLQPRAGHEARTAGETGLWCRFCGRCRRTCGVLRTLTEGRLAADRTRKGVPGIQGDRIRL